MRNRYTFRLLARGEAWVRVALEVNGRLAGELVLDLGSYHQFVKDLTDGTGQAPFLVVGLAPPDR